MLNLSQEKVLYHALREKIDYYNLTKPNYFNNNDIKVIFGIDKEFTEKYRNVPSKYQILQIAAQKGIKDVTESKLDSIFDIDIADYDKTWIDENLGYWIEFQTLHQSVVDVSEYMQSTPVSASNIKQYVQTAKDIIAKRNNISLDFDIGLDFFNAESHKQPKYNTFSTGYPFLDRCLGGGFKKKSLVVFCGRQKIGKSIWLSNLAVNASKRGSNTVYVSFELEDHDVIKRLGANILNIKMDDYDKFSENEDKVKKKLENVELDMLTLKPGQLVVKRYPMSSIGVPDVERYLQKLEEVKGEKFDLIVLDYLNIMMDWHSPSSDNTYLKIKRISEDLRAMGTRNDWCIVSATQINREGSQSNDLTTSNISESMALVSTVDALFGIIQDSFMALENKYNLKAMALRNARGIDEKKEYHIDYDYMRITENMEVGTQSASDFEDLTR